MSALFGIVAFAAFIVWTQTSLSPFSVFAPRARAGKSVRERGRIDGRRAAWYFLIAICVSGIALALAQQAKAQDIPSPSQGCRAFNAQGRMLAPSEMTDLQLMQAMNCEKIVQRQEDFERQTAEFQSDSDAIDAKLQASAGAFANAPATGYAAPIPTPLPGNTPILILQSQ